MLVDPNSEVGGAWQFAGPQPIAGDYGGSSGRVTSLAVDPTDAAVVYAGTAGGGVWKTTNSGSSWTPLTDGQVTLAIGAVAVDPNNHLTVYAGTGEANESVDSQYGQGVLKSTDGGATWSLYGQTLLGGHFIYAVAVDRTNSNHVLVAASTGLFTSTDGGQTYALNNSLLALSPNNTTYVPRVNALIQDPDSAHASRWYAAVDERCLESGFIGVSADGGSTWTQSIRVSSLSGTPDIARFGMGEGPGGVLYATMAACASKSPAFGDGQLVGLLKSTDYGSTWTLNGSMPDLFMSGDESQGWYDNTVAVDPTNASRAVFGGITMLSTTDGGSTFTDIAKPYSGGPVHADFHAVAFTGANSFYTGNDGGVWRTSDLGGTGSTGDWTNLNATLAVTTFYAGDAADTAHMIGGAQDEGTSGLLPGGPKPPAWNALDSGDGGLVSMIAGTTTYYGEQSYGAIFKGDYTKPGSVTAAGPCGSTGTDPACPETSGLVTPFVVDPANPSIIFTAGTHLYRSTTGGLPAGSGGWSQISGDLTSGTTNFIDGDYVSAIGISADGNELAIGTEGGKLWFVSNATGSPTFADLTSSVPAFNLADYTGSPWITSVSGVRCQAGACGATVTLGAIGVARVIEVSTSGQPNDIEGNLVSLISGAVINNVLVNDQGTFIASDAGVYACFLCTVGNNSWFAIGTGLPNAKVDRISMTADGKDLIAWTHGRGAWILPRVAASSLSANSIDFGGVTPGEGSASQYVWYRNSGLVTTQVTSITVTGPNASDFQVPTAWTCMFDNQTSGLPLTLWPGSSCQLVVVFSPTLSTTETATVTVINSATPPLTVALTGSLASPTVTLSPTAVTYPTTTVGMHNISNEGLLTVSNSGPGYLDVKGYQLTGANPGDFVYVADGCSNVRVAPGKSCTVNVVFEPTAPGTRTATFSILDNAPDSPQTVSLSGDAIQPSITLTPTAIDFGGQNAGTTGGAQVVQVTNNGPGMLFMFGAVNPGWPGYGVTITGPNAADFSWTNVSCYGGIPVGETCTLSVQFSPPASASGTRTATLVLTDNATGSPQLITLTGKATAPIITASPTPVDFGTVDWHGSVSRVVTVTNTGTGTLTLGPLYTRSPFSIPTATDFCSWQTVAPGATCSVTVVFTPNGAAYPPQRTTGDLQISQSNPNLPMTHVALSGTAVAPALSLTPPPPLANEFYLTYPTAALGASNSVTFTVQNWITNGNGSNIPGAEDLHVTAFSVSGANPADFTVAGQTCIGVAVAPSSTCTVTLMFKPTATGTRTASLNIASDAYCCISSIAVEGSAVASAPCSAATIGATPASPAAQGSAVTITGTAATCGKPLYRFWLRPPGQSWTIVQNYSASPTLNWNTAAYGGGTYALEVDVRDQGSTASYDAVATGTYTLAVCSSLSLSTGSQSPQVAGATVVLTASASCPGTAEYRFWISQGGVWTKVQDYSSSNTYSWNTTGKPAGTYGLEVDVRDHGSTLAYDLVKNSSFALTTPTCGVPAFTAIPASQAGTGAKVTLSGSTSGCPNPQYRFWIAPPGGSWSVVQNYGTLSTYTWTSTGNAGSYRLEVDVRDLSSTASYDHYAAKTYTLVACSAAQLTANPQSPQQAGPTVTLTASATCLGTPEYRFWVRDTTGKWSIVQDYGTSNTFTWNTANLPAGTYGLEVDVRDKGSTASYETVQNSAFQVS